MVFLYRDGAERPFNRQSLVVFIGLVHADEHLLHVLKLVLDVFQVSHGCFELVRELIYGGGWIFWNWDE